MKQGKIWGNTQLLFNKSNVEIHRLIINKGGYCSKHKHKHKYNMFFVESGIIEVHVEKNDYHLIDTTVLTAGDITIVKPGEYHWFKGLNTGVVYEIYWTELDSNDIDRETIGGVA